MNNAAHIKTQRQKRAIEELLSRDYIQVNDMGPLIGALNPRQTIMELRRQGFLGIILTRRFYIDDRDGKGCRPGEYYILKEQKPLAREALNKYAASTSANAKAAVEQMNLNRGV